MLCVPFLLLGETARSTEASTLCSGDNVLLARWSSRDSTCSRGEWTWPGLSTRSREEWTWPGLIVSTLFWGFSSLLGESTFSGFMPGECDPSPCFLAGLLIRAKRVKRSRRRLRVSAPSKPPEALSGEIGSLRSSATGFPLLIGISPASEASSSSRTSVMTDNSGLPRRQWDEDDVEDDTMGVLYPVFPLALCVELE